MKTLGSRILTILAVISAFQVICITGLYLVHLEALRTRSYAFMIGDVALAQKVLRSIPTGQRQPWLHALDRGFYHFEIDDGQGGWTEYHGDPRLDSALHAIETGVPAAAQSRSVVKRGDKGAIGGLSVPLDAHERMLVWFDPEQPFSPPAVGLVVSYLSLVLLCLWAAAWLAIRSATRPLSRLSEAARALARNLDAPPMVEAGPAEVAAAARAFNTMQTALKRHLDDRTQMLAAVSHDLKTPLTRLCLRVQGLPASEQRSLIEGDIEAISALVREGLAYAQSTQLREARVPVDLNQLLQGLVEQNTDLDHRVSLAGRVKDACRCVPRALERAVQNLVDNAVRYGGSARILLSEDSQQIEIAIDDDGPGLPPDMLEQAFDPYVRLDASRGRHDGQGGTGLGLPIARNLIEAHGGQVTLENRPGGGLRARIRLPK